MDNYHLVERLGQGAFAIVWKARRKNDNRVVAVKQLKQAPSTWEECKRLPEIRAAGLARGPHVISLLEACRHGSELFLVFEYADSDLYRCLGPCERRRFEEPQVSWVMRQLFSGLSSVHAAGLVHCDVKPENLLLFLRLGPCGEPVLKLCDLGQATPAGEVGSYVGTRWYRSPELLLGNEHNGPEIDLWAAGALMAELILLRPPFPGTDTRDMLFRICSALGAPEDSYSKSEQLMQASGLRFAPCAAEGPLWFELSSTGASSAAVEIVRGMLRYSEHKRLPAAQAVNSRFFTSGALEVPLLPPEKGREAHRSAEGLARSRDEAKAVSRKLQAASAARGIPSGGFGGFSNDFNRPAASGLGGLGLFGGVLDVGGAPVHPGLGTSASSPSLPSNATPAFERSSFDRHHAPMPEPASKQAGYFGLGTSSSSSSLVPGRESPASLGDAGLRRQQTERSGLGLPLASRRLAQAQQGRARVPRDLTQGVAIGTGLPPAPREFHRPSPEPWGSIPQATSGAGRGNPLGMDRARPVSSSADSSDDSPIGAAVPKRSAGLLAPEIGAKRLGQQGGRSCEVNNVGEDDEELANLFWNQVKHK